MTRVCVWVWVHVLCTPCFLSWLDNTQQLDGRWQVAHTWSTVKVVPSMFHGWSIPSYPDHIPAQLHIGYRIQLSILYVTLPSKWVTVIPFVILRYLYHSREHKMIFKMMHKLTKSIHWSCYYYNLNLQHHSILILRNQQSFHHSAQQQVDACLKHILMTFINNFCT